MNDASPAAAPERRLPSVVLNGLRLLGVISPFLILELCLWLVAYAPPVSPLMRGLGGDLQVLVEVDDGWALGPDFADSALAAPIPRSKAPDELRIFSVGDSITWGHAGNEVPDPLQSYTWQLRDQLAARPDGDRYRVVNFGSRGFASQRVLAVAERVLTLEPDVLIASFGSSEHLERHTFLAWEREQELSRGWLGRYRTRQLLGAWLNRSGSGAWGLDLAQLRQRDAVLDAPRIAPMCRQRGPGEADEVAAGTMARLERLVQLSEQADVPLVLLTVPSHLRWPPFAGLPLVVEDRDAVEQALAQATTSLEQHQPEAALRLLEPVLDRQPGLSALWYRRAQALDALGRSDEAAQAYGLARDLDACPLRAPSAHNQHLRQLAVAHPGVTLVEVDRLLEAQVADGIPDDRLFLDHCHPTQAAHGLVAQALLEVLTQGGFLGAADPSD